MPSKHWMALSVTVDLSASASTLSVVIVVIILLLLPVGRMSTTLHSATTESGSDSVVEPAFPDTSLYTTTLLPTTSSTAHELVTVTSDHGLHDLPHIQVAVDELPAVAAAVLAAESSQLHDGDNRDSVKTIDAASTLTRFPDVADEDDDDVDGMRWCQFDSGPATVADHRTGRRYDVHVSLSRDGSVWARVGTASLDWSAIAERRRRLQAAVLDDNAIDTLRFLLVRQRRRLQRQRLLSQRQQVPWTGSTIDRCVLTDVDLSITVVGGWNPSYVAALDSGAAAVGGGGRADTQIVSIRNLREDCRAAVNITLSADKQTVRCDISLTSSTTMPTINACGLRVVPERTSSYSVPAASAGSASRGGFSSSPGVFRWGSTRSESPMFIKYISMDPNGTEKWYCNDHDERNRYTLTGSYYYAYVKVATCPPPSDSRSLGDDVILRPNRDPDPNYVILPDPSRPIMSDGVLQAWHIYAKIVSIEHRVYLQVWRPLHAATDNFRSPNSTFSFRPLPASSATVGEMATDSGPGVYRLVGQTYVEPTTLRFDEIILRADQFIQVARGDLLGLYFPRFNPIGWSSVPCSSAAQRFAFVRSPPANFTVGSSFQFKWAEDGIGRYPCRYYSFAAFFANRTRSKLVEDQRCPGSISASTPVPGLQSPGPAARSASAAFGSGPQIPGSLSPSSTADCETALRSESGVANGRPVDLACNRQLERRRNDRGWYEETAATASAAVAGRDVVGPPSTFFVLLVVAILLLAMVVVGSISYCVAVRKSGPDAGSNSPTPAAASGPSQSRFSRRRS